MGSDAARLVPVASGRGNPPDGRIRIGNVFNGLNAGPRGRWPRSTRAPLLLDPESLQEVLVALRLAETVDEELHGLDGLHLAQHASEHPHLLEVVRGDQQLLLAGARLGDVDRREGALVGELALERMISELPVPLNSSKITSSMRLPVSISAVAMMVRLPPSSMLRAAPKKRLGRCRALESTPPVRILPLGGPPCCRRARDG
jgi:hypothetical protein